MIKENISLLEESKKEVIDQNQQNRDISPQGKENQQYEEDYDYLFYLFYKYSQKVEGLDAYFHYLEKCDEKVLKCGDTV